MKRNAFTRVFAALLCLVLTISLLPADLLGEWLGDLLPSTNAAALNITPDSRGKVRIDGLYYIRSKANPEMVITPYSYLGDITFGRELYATAIDSTKFDLQTFIFRQDYRRAENADYYVNRSHMLGSFRPLRALYQPQVSTTTNVNFYVRSSNDAANPGKISIERTNEGSATANTLPEDCTIDGSPENSGFLWTFFPVGDIDPETGIYTIYIQAYNANNANHSYRMTYNGAGAKVTLAAQSSAVEQQWELVPVHVPENMWKIDGVTGFIESSLSGNSTYTSADGDVLSIGSAAALVGAIDTFQSGPAWDRHWTFVKTSLGYYSIIHNGTNRYLVSTGIGLYAKANFGNHAYPSGENYALPSLAEQWMIVPTAVTTTNNGSMFGAVTDVTFSIINAQTGLALYVTGNISANDAVSLQGCRKNYTTEQSWRIKDGSKITTTADGAYSLLSGRDSASTNVYFDTFDRGKTMVLPMQIYDYAVDQVLFDNLTDGLPFNSSFELGAPTATLKSIARNGKTIWYPEFGQTDITNLASKLETACEGWVATSTGGSTQWYSDTSFILPDWNTQRKDLQTVIREHGITDVGTWAATSAKAASLIGTWNEVKANVTTYMDMAYFLLNSLLIPDSWNYPQYTFNGIELTAVMDNTGKQGYIFDASFATSAAPTYLAGTSVAYDFDNGKVYNTSAVGKAVKGDGTDYHQFNPIYAGREVVKNDVYYIMAFQGNFVYHADDNAFFDFIGDDDAILYINNQMIANMDDGAEKKITLNDLVDEAWSVKNGGGTYNGKTYANLSASEKAYIDAMALNEGDRVDLDFFNIARTNTKAQLRVFTNMILGDTSLEAQKTAYQNGTEIPYGGVVEKTQPIEYGFELRNNSNFNFYNLQFNDPAIGVTMNKNGLTVANGYNGVRVFDKNGGTLEAADLSIEVREYYANSDEVKATYTVANPTRLGALMENMAFNGKTTGLLSNYSIFIRGIYYKMSAADIDAARFKNTVTAVADDGKQGDAATGFSIEALSTMLIRISGEPFFLQWAGKNLVISKNDFVTKMLATNQYEEDAANGLTVANVTSIGLCNERGTDTSYQLGVTIDSNYTITFSHADTGAHHHTLKVNYTSGGNTYSLIAAFPVFAFDVVDKPFVLDYGLAVNFSQAQVLEGDTLTASGISTQYNIVGMTATAPSYANNNISFTKDADGVIQGTYGTFKLANGQLTYTPSKFMSGADSIWIAIGVSRAGAVTTLKTSVDTTNEVQLYKKVTVLPSNVVYYEDSMTGSIQYTDFNEIENLGSLDTSLSTGQDSAQDVIYGYDDGAYAKSEDVAVSGQGCVKLPVIDMNTEAVKFTFTGTGFELLSRTNAYDSATMLIYVTDPDGKTNIYPVISRFEQLNGNGKDEVFQVPIFHLKNGKFGKYTVVVKGLPMQEYDQNGVVIPGSLKNSYIYVDGIRVYNPLNDDSLTSLYGEEKDAQFIEIHDMILGTDKTDSDPIRAAVATYNETSGKVNAFTLGNYYYLENSEGLFSGNLGGLHELKSIGPNNEVYLRSANGSYVLVFYVKETAANQGLLHIGIHDVHDSKFDGTTAENLESSVYYGTANGWATLCNKIKHGTEQYYEINLAQCPSYNGYYQVALKVQGFVSFSNIKYKNLTFMEFNSVAPGTTITYNADGTMTLTQGNGSTSVMNASNFFNLMAVEAQTEKTAIVPTVPKNTIFIDGDTENV